MPITDEVRKYGETVLEEARKPWYAAVGAGELAYGQIQAQLSQLPTEVQARLRKLQQSGTQLDATTVRSAVESAAEQAVGAYGTATAQAKQTYESLAHRGELTVRRLRRSPEIKSGFDRAEDVLAEAGNAVAAVDEKVTKPGPKTTPTPAGSATPARTAPARKAPARKATARKATSKS